MSVYAVIEQRESLMMNLEEIGHQLRRFHYPDRELSQDAQFKQVAHQYNTVVEALNIVDKIAWPDPIKAFPEEIWFPIMKHAITTDSKGSMYRSAAKALELTLVSSKWSRCIRSTPLLWTDIVLDDSIQDLEATVAISLELSQQVVLNVHMNGRMRCWSTIRPILVPHKTRIQRVHLSSNDLVHALRGNIKHIIPQLYSPTFQTIDWTHHGPSPGPVNHIFLQLQQKKQYIRYFFPLLLGKETFHLPAVNNLRELTTHEDAKRILDIADIFPNLRKVVFLDMSHTYEAGSAEPAEEIQLNSTKALNWTSLTYNQCIIDTLTSMLARLPHLLNIKLILPYEYLSQTMSCMQDLQKLRRLDIRLWMLPSLPFISPIVRSPLEAVHDFSFSDQGQISDSDRRERLSQVPGAFFALIPNVEALEIQSNQLSVVHALASTNRFQRLRTLDLNFGEDYVHEYVGTQQAPTFQLPSTVEELRLNGANFTLESNFMGPGVEFLTASSIYLTGKSNKRVAEHKWTKLYKLKISTIYGDETAISQPFINLTTLFVDAHHPDHPTNVCAYIASYPNSFPALHTISFNLFPELDTLFIMLEQKNVVSQPYSARFKSLFLPIVLERSVYTPIRDLLHGLLVDRMSNAEVSDWGNKDRFLDQALPGCLSCLRAQSFCDAFTKVDRRPAAAERFSQWAPEDPDLGDEISEIGNERVFIGEAILRIRPLTCQKWREALIETTGDSLECTVPQYLSSSN